MTPDRAISLANDISCVITTLQAISDELMTAYPDSDYSRDEEITAQQEPPKPEVKLEQVRALLAEKSRDGFTTEIKALLIKNGATRLSDIDTANYVALLAEAEVLRK